MDKSAMVTMARPVTVAAGVLAPGHLGELTEYMPFELVDDVLEETLRVQRGGTLLIASHDLADLPPDQHGIDPADYYQPGDITRLLDDTWTIVADETRPRTAPAPAGTRHTHDTILRAQRPG